MPEARRARTGEALREDRRDAGERDAFRRNTAIKLLDSEGIAITQKRGDPDSSRGGAQLHTEFCSATVVAKRKIGKRAEEGLISGIEMSKFSRGLTDEEFSSFMMARTSCKGLHLQELGRLPRRPCFQLADACARLPWRRHVSHRRQVRR